MKREKFSENQKVELLKSPAILSVGVCYIVYSPAFRLHALEEYQKDGDEKAFLSALALAARVHGGFSKLSKATGLNRENLYRALSKRSDPRLSTIMQVLGNLGLSLTIR